MNMKNMLFCLFLICSYALSAKVLKAKNTLTAECEGKQYAFAIHENIESIKREAGVLLDNAASGEESFSKERIHQIISQEGWSVNDCDCSGDVMDRDGAIKAIMIAAVNNAFPAAQVIDQPIIIGADTTTPVEFLEPVREDLSEWVVGGDTIAPQPEFTIEAVEEQAEPVVEEAVENIQDATEECMKEIVEEVIQLATEEHEWKEAQIEVIENLEEQHEEEEHHLEEQHEEEEHHLEEEHHEEEQSLYEEHIQEETTIEDILENRAEEQKLREENSKEEEKVEEKHEQEEEKVEEKHEQEEEKKEQEFEQQAEALEEKQEDELAQVEEEAHEEAQETIAEACTEAVETIITETAEVVLPEEVTAEDVEEAVEEESHEEVQEATEEVVEQATEVVEEATNEVVETVQESFEQLEQVEEEHHEEIEKIEEEPNIVQRLSSTELESVIFIFVDSKTCHGKDLLNIGVKKIEFKEKPNCTVYLYDKSDSQSGGGVEALKNELKRGKIL